MAWRSVLRRPSWWQTSPVVSTQRSKTKLMTNITSGINTEIKDQADDKHHQWYQHRDQSRWTEAWDSHKLQVPGFSYNWWGFQALAALQDSTDDSSIHKVETSLDWQDIFSVPRCNWCAPFSQPSYCMLVNRWPSQQSCKEEYKPWKWDATARYYTSNTKTMLPTRKPVPICSRQLDHMKIWPL